MKAYPITKTQQMVLEALNLTANGYNEAAKMLEARGIELSGRRVGRSTVPVVRRMTTYGGGWNPGGDGAEFEIEYEPVDWSKLAQWMEEQDDQDTTEHPGRRIYHRESQNPGRAVQ